jgi:hypothetical protein
VGYSPRTLLRPTVYGTSGIAYDPDDYRAHGKDERILVKSFNEGLVFAYQMAKAIGTPR